MEHVNMVNYNFAHISYIRKCPVKFFKNTELAKIYRISEKSVRNWIEAARAGRLALDLVEDKNRMYIANTSRNTVMIQQLVEKGKKYTNSRGRQTIKPTAKFYEIFDSKQ